VVVVETSEELKSPIELLELKDGETVKFRIERWQKGKITIHPRTPGAPPEKVVECLRIWVPTEYKKWWPPYWDITANRLRTQLEGFLTRPDLRLLEFTVTAHGSAPRTRYTIETRVLPR